MKYIKLFLKNSYTKQANYKMKILNLTCIFNADVFRNLHALPIFHILLYLLLLFVCF